MKKKFGRLCHIIKTNHPEEHIAKMEDSPYQVVIDSFHGTLVDVEALARRMRFHSYLLFGVRAFAYAPFSMSSSHRQARHKVKSLGHGTLDDNDGKAQRGEVKREFVLSFVNSDCITPNETNSEQDSSIWRPV